MSAVLFRTCPVRARVPLPPAVAAVRVPIPAAAMAAAAKAAPTEWVGPPDRPA